MKNINANTAINAAVSYASVYAKDVCNLDVRHTEGFYEVTFENDWTRYDCYVDDADGEVLGFDSRPLPEHVMLAELNRATA